MDTAKHIEQVKKNFADFAAGNTETFFDSLHPDVVWEVRSPKTPKTHLERFTLEPTDRAVRATVNAETTLRAGFTTVRDLRAGGPDIISVRNAINRGLIPGPRIHAAEKSLATTGGHADPTNGMRRALRGDPGPAAGVVDGPEEARKAVRDRKSVV